MDDCKPPPTLADWVVTALSPILVMLMVGSLVFFLIEVLYGGKYSDRLVYTFFFFVAGAVLIARIAIDRGSKLAALYGGGLGLVTFIAMLQFVEFPTPLMRAIGPIINIALMALVWWAANKLTWDCTHIDEAKKASGKGVLAAAGLDATAAETNPVQAKEDADAAADEKKEAKKRRKDSAGFGGWLARYERYKSAKADRPHTPGVWVVYFALAAVPLFALGQALIPGDDSARRRATFLQMAVYVGSALALLVTTSLLGLRKYLRERNATVPAAMTVGWLGVGGALILFFLGVGAVLPRPHSETPLFKIDRGGKADRNASKNAVVKDNAAGKGDGAAGKKNEAGDGKQSAKGGKKDGGNGGEKGDGGGKGDGKGGKEKGGDKGGPNKDDGGKQKGDGNDDKKGDQDGGKEQGGDAGEAKQDAEEEAGDADGSTQSSDSPSKIGQALEKVGSFVKWIVWIAIAIAVIAGLVWFALRGLAPFTDWAKNLLAWFRDLFRPKVKDRTGRGEEVEEEVEVETAVPFTAFSDPFEDGSHRRKSPRELVEYSFAAMEAWAAERGEGRAPAETPEEFGRRLAAEHPELDEAGRKLAAVLVRCLYAPGDAPPDAVKAAKAFWAAVGGVAAM